MGTCYNFQTDLVLIKTGLYWPNFSLVFLIHLFLCAGVNCISYKTALDKAALSTLSDHQKVSCIKFIGKVQPGNPVYPVIHNRVVPISTSVCLRSESSSRPMATRTECFSNFVSVKY